LHCEKICCYFVFQSTFEMNEQEQLNTLTDIRNLMERSSRFLSLSGLSGVFIGIYALAGTAAGWWYVNSNNYVLTSYYSLATAPEGKTNQSFLDFFIADAAIILLLSLITGFVLTQKKAKQQGLKIWDATAKRMLINLIIPLLTGGVYCLVLLYHQQIDLVAPSMLIFYGLALLNASKYTYNDIRYLGVLEILLGLTASLHVGYGLIFWGIGFGVLHIIYGISMYYKYER
jgi:hypothetical protein